jgi:hypothetical protein
VVGAALLLGPGSAAKSLNEADSLIAQKDPQQDETNSKEADEAITRRPAALRGAGLEAR